jgi:hypothetical protein
MQPYLAKADGHLYVLCSFCISKQHLPIIEIESNPELHDVVRANLGAWITQSATED